MVCVLNLTGSPLNESPLLHTLLNFTAVITLVMLLLAATQTKVRITLVLLRYSLLHMNAENGVCGKRRCYFSLGGVISVATIVAQLYSCWH
jgi:hypothetical protein